MKSTKPKFETRSMYRDRRLAEGHPELARGYLETFPTNLDHQPDGTPRIDRLLNCMDRVTDARPRKDVLVVGCGPRPETMRVLKNRGYRVTGVDPVPGFVKGAEEYLGGSNEVVQGWAEALPLPDSSQDLILCESVLEHVGSPRAALVEMHRALRPGGIAFVITTNRLRFHLLGRNGEYNVPFFNWLPPMLQESYVFRHLHYDPTLASYSTHPAVHWFTFAELCRLGRECGFERFYSLLDLLLPEGPFAHGTCWKRRLVKALQHSAWLRALALTQTGGVIVMFKPNTNGAVNGSLHKRERLDVKSDSIERLHLRPDEPTSPSGHPFERK